MGEKLFLFVFFSILALIVVAIAFIVMFVFTHCFWIAAANPKSRYHRFWIDARERYPDDQRKQKRDFMFSVESWRRYFGGPPPTDEELKELRDMIEPLSEDDV